MAEINLDLAFNFAQGTNPTLFDVTGVSAVRFSEGDFVK
jgi:hypothetical protein